MSSFSLKNRRKCERLIAERVIGDLLAAGYHLTVNNGEEDELVDSADKEIILKAMFTTDEDYLIALKPETKGGPQLGRGWVRFIYGNDGPDVVNDYTTNLEEIMKGASALADKLEEEGL